MKPTAVMIPFGYPGYPDELMERFTRESSEIIRGLGIEVSTTDLVKVFADARKVGGDLRRSDFDLLVVLILSWIEAPNVLEAIQEQTHKPILLWSHTMWREGNERLTLGPIPGVGVIRETFEEMGLTFRFIYGQPGEEKVREPIRSFANLTAAKRRLGHAKIGLLGYGSMGMYTADFDRLSLKRDLGPEIEQQDQYLLIKRIEEMDDRRIAPIKADAKANWEISKNLTEHDIDVTLKMYQALKDMVEEFGWSALTVKCQYELSKIYKHVPCVPLSMLGNDLPCSCEGDVPLITTQLMMHYLSGGKVVTYCDLHTIDEQSLLLGACGFAPFALGEGRPKVDKTTTLYEGMANCTVYQEGPVTLARLGYTPQRGYKMHIARGRARKPGPFHEVGCLPYPSMEVTLEGSCEEFAQHLMSQHYAIVYGNYTKDLNEFCALMNITPVNV